MKEDGDRGDHDAAGGDPCIAPWIADDVGLDRGVGRHSLIAASDSAPPAAAASATMRPFLISYIRGEDRGQAALLPAAIEDHSGLDLIWQVSSALVPHSLSYMA